MQLGNAIRIQRAIKGYSQEYMASRLNISQNAYSKLEREETEISVKRIYEIAEILEISIYQLLPEVRSGALINPDWIRWLYFSCKRFLNKFFHKIPQK